MADFVRDWFMKDILIDNITRRVTKIILHTNVPGQYDFLIYSRCNFALEIPGTTKVIQTESKLDEFREIFASPEVDDDGNMTGETIVKPVVVNKCSTGAENPFGATFCYGHKQLIVECLDDSHVATVILFPEASEPGSETSSVNSVSVE
uniref:SERPIN domain-containing protein n=1 Tax=Panagrellus redivivus TaxID=6233 RepID=A0A7E4ZQR3_PANRE